VACVDLVSRLVDRVTILQATSTTDSLGGQTTTWSTVATPPAEFRNLNGRESIQAGALQSSMTHRALIRYRSDVTTKMRLRCRSTTCDITSVRDPDGRRVSLELDLVEVP
jgi:SPP1 family predicted phage head-tail adaptor